MFRDRVEAGQRLGERLESFRAGSPVILGLPRGGVPVAAEIARALAAPLDVIVVRKLGVPWHRELGFGAIGEGDVIVVDDEVVAMARIRPSQMESVISSETEELERRVLLYRGDHAPVPLTDRTAIVVDDGIATGVTTRAAIEVARRRGAGRVVVAAPVASPRTLEALRSLADEIVVISSEETFFSVGQFYGEFPQLGDEEVTRILSEGPSR